MLLVFLLVGAVLVFVIAAVLVGGETFRLGHTPTTTVFDLEEAVDHVATHLSDEAAVGLTMEEVRDLIGFSLDHFRSKGVTALPGEDLSFEEEGPPVVLADDDAVAVVLGRADEHDMVVTDAAVLEVLDLLLDHLHHIGALGPIVRAPDDPALDDPS